MKVNFILKYIIMNQTTNPYITDPINTYQDHKFFYI